MKGRTERVLQRVVDFCALVGCPPLSSWLSQSLPFAGRLSCQVAKTRDSLFVRGSLLSLKDHARSDVDELQGMIKGYVGE